jgi:SAM-dependent methyltransferase
VRRADGESRRRWRVTRASSKPRLEDHLLSISRGAATPPPVARDTRRELATELVRGSGIEIGALHLPMVLPAGVNVRYVDRMTVPELRAHYPELDGQDLAPVDVVDDGETLSTIEPESVDFILANHFLEHCEDPIRTITTHLGKLRPGGMLFYAVPDKRYTFDFRRPRTPLSHLIADHEDGGQGSRQEHYLEWARLVYPEDDGPPDEQAIRERLAALEATSYSIHFHVWTQTDLLQLMLHCQDRLGSFEIEAVRRVGLENIVVLRKHGEQVIEPSAAAQVAVPMPSHCPPVPDPEARIMELERELADARRDAERAREEARVLDQRVTMGDQVLADVFNSLSWRLTQPLRSAKRQVARLRAARGR